VDEPPGLDDAVDGGKKAVKSSKNPRKKPVIEFLILRN